MSAAHVILWLSEGMKLRYNELTLQLTTG